MQAKFLASEKYLEEDSKDEYSRIVCMAVMNWCRDFHASATNVGLFLFRLQPAGITTTLQRWFTPSCNRFQPESVIATGLLTVNSVEISLDRSRNIDSDFNHDCNLIVIVIDT